MGKINVPIHPLQNSVGLDLPSYATEASAGADLVAAIDVALPLESGEWKAVPTGISIALPEGYEAQVRPRSGLAMKYGITCLNSPGTIDADYRGEIFVILINHGKKLFKIERGMRIAQLVLAQVCVAKWNKCNTLSATVRGKKGLGSTGEKEFLSKGKGE